MSLALAHPESQGGEWAGQEGPRHAGLLRTRSAPGSGEETQASSGPGAGPPGQPRPDSPTPAAPAAGPPRRAGPSVLGGREGRPAGPKAPRRGLRLLLEARPVGGGGPGPRGWRRPRSASRWPRGPGGAASSRRPSSRGGGQRPDPAGTPPPPPPPSARPPRPRGRARRRRRVRSCAQAGPRRAPRAPAAPARPPRPPPAPSYALPNGKFGSRGVSPGSRG